MRDKSHAYKAARCPHGCTLRILVANTLAFRKSGPSPRKQIAKSKVASGSVRLYAVYTILYIVALPELTRVQSKSLRSMPRYRPVTNRPSL